MDGLKLHEEAGIVSTGWRRLVAVEDLIFQAEMLVEKLEKVGPDERLAATREALGKAFVSMSHFAQDIGTIPSLEARWQELNGEAKG